jgi:serine/threonine protein kinase
MGGGNSRPKTQGPWQPKGRDPKSVYVLKDVLGKGAYSIVQRGIRKKDQSQVAVKIVKKNKLLPVDVNALNVEIELLSELTHPNIVKLYEVYETNSEISIVTELVLGGELFDRIVKRSTYTEKQARDLARIVVSAFGYLHSKQIVHRDIKPENLLLVDNSNDVNIKIADFGFAIKVKDLTVNEDPCGTPSYVAPELLRRDR